MCIRLRILICLQFCVPELFGSDIERVVYIGFEGELPLEQ